MAKRVKAQEPTETIKAMKGFDKNLACRGFQFEVGKTYEQAGTIDCCSNGFHAITGSPFDIWDYYPVVADDGSLSRYAEVTLAGATDRQSDGEDSKIAAAKITVDVEISLPDFIRRAVAWVVDATKGKGDNPSGDSARIGSSGHYAQIGSSGDSARIGSSGHYARIGSSGHYAQIGSSGDSARIGSSGHYARIGSSGISARIGSSGHYAQIGSSGDSARIGSSGHYARIGSSGISARIGSSGDSAQIAVEGNNSVVASAGIAATVSGPEGTWVSLAEFDRAGKCIGFATGCIGKDGLLPGVSYRAQDGKLVAA
jgi:hypothetical protein